MADTALELEIKADLTQLRTQLAEVNVALRTMAGGVGATVPSFQAADQGAKTFYERLRGMKGEAVQHQRTFMFFGRQLEAMGIAGKEAGAALTGVFAGLASGMWIMALIEGVKFVVEMFREWKKEAKEAAEATEKAAKQAAEGVAKAIKSFQESVIPQSNVQKYMAVARAGMEAEAAKVDEELEELNKKWAKGEISPEKAVKKKGELEQRRGWINETLEYIEVNARARLEAIDNARIEIENWRVYNEEMARLGEQRKAQAVTDAKAAAEARRITWINEARGLEEIPEEMAKKPIDMFQVEENAQKALAAHQKVLNEMEKQRLESLRNQQQSTREFYESMAEEAELYGDPFKAADFRKQARLVSGELPEIVNAKYLKEVGQAWNTIGQSIGGAFSAMGNAIGGQAGKMMNFFGQMIQQAIQLAVALSATAGPWGWVNAAVAAASLLATIMSVPKFEQGTPYVPRTGLAILHQGEAVIPAGEAEAWRGGGGGNTTIIIQAADAASVRKMMLRNADAVAAAGRKLARNRRG